MESKKEPDVSHKELIDIFLTFIANLQKEYIQRYNTLTAYIVTLVKVNKEVVGEITHLAEKVSTCIEDKQKYFRTNADLRHTLILLENDVMSVHRRLSTWVQGARYAP
jgi:hypothetical protein